MICMRCSEEVADGAYCLKCGARQQKPERNPKKRGNGQGSVYKLSSGKYKAVAILGFYIDADGKTHRRTRSAVFDKKKDAVAALPGLRKTNQKKQDKITFKELYDKWFPTHRAGKSTMDCYKAAMRYFAPCWHMQMSEIDVDDLQECVDSCGKGKRTQQNMKAVCGLIYKFGIPRNCTPNNLNLAQFLVVGGDNPAHREAFTDEQIKKISGAINTVPYADYVYCLIYLGFRPSEFLALDAQNYDRHNKCFVGGSKTEAGTNRIVTVSPKIQPIIDKLVDNKISGAVFSRADGAPLTLNEFTEKCFYSALENIGIDNPMVEIGGGVKRHKYTPHSCRHTFATLMKRVDAPSRDKQELIGHTTEEMLRYYQDVDIADLRKITDKI